MKRRIKRAFSTFMVVVLTLTVAPLSGLVGINVPNLIDTSIVAEAATQYNLYWPVPTSAAAIGRISSAFGPRKSPTTGASTNHRGIDIPVGSGTSVYAAYDGVVVAIGKTNARGNYVLLYHSSIGLSTLYQHLTCATVQKGDTVSGGSQIALSGNTGIGTGAHLHYGVMVGKATKVDNDQPSYNMAINPLGSNISYSSSTGKIVSSDNPDDYTYPTRDLFYTSPVKTGNDVKWVQAVLWRLGYDISIDGSFGPATRDVVKQFQANYGLDVDGSCGPATRSKLLEQWNKKKNGNINITLHAWLSNEAYGDIPDSYVCRESLYLNYELIDSDTLQKINDLVDKTYTTTLTFYTPNGTAVNSDPLQNRDVGCFKLDPTRAGTWKAKVVVTGDVNREVNLSVTVVYDASINSSVSSVSLNLNGTNSSTIALSPTGAYPGAWGMSGNYDNTIVEISDSYESNGVMYVVLKGLKQGTTNLKITLFEKYSGNNEAVTTITIPITVTANSYTINYNANGGSGVPSSQTKYYGTDITLSSTVPTRFGYTFLGWSTSSSATSATYLPGANFSENSNTTLYAVWKAATTLSIGTTYSSDINFASKEIYYTFTPSSSGNFTFASTGSLDSQVCIYNSSGTVLANNDDISDSDRNFSLSYNLTGGIKYYIKVKAYSNKTGTTSFNITGKYTVNYNANGGSGAPSAQTKIHGTTLTLSSGKPTRTGYTFTGWNTKADGTGTNYSAGGSYTANANITLYAVWGESTETTWLKCGENSHYKYYLDKGYVIIHSPNLSEMYENFYAFDGDVNVKLVDVTASSISNYAFRNCVNLTKVVLQSGLKTIGNYTFKGCTSLTTLILPDELISIGTGAFLDCSSLTDVVLPDGLISIGANAFAGSGITEITIPSSVTTIGADAFDSNVVIYGDVNTAAQTYAKQNGNTFIPLNASTLFANTSINAVSILSGGYIQYYTYTPTTGGLFVIYSEGSEDTMVSLYDIYGRELANDDDSGSNNNFRLEYNLSAGTKYIFAIKYKSLTATGVINVKLRNIYTVIYDANGGANAPTMQNKEHGANIALSSAEPTKTGCLFLGWSTSSSATTATYQPGSSFDVNANTTLYAVWKANTPLILGSSYYVTVDTPGKKGYYSFTPSTTDNYVIYSTDDEDTKVYLYDSNGTELTSDDDGGDDSNFRLQYKMTAGVTYYFKVGYWSSTRTGEIPFKFGKVYAVTYNANGGSGSPSSQTKDYGTALTLSSTTPTRTGYTLLGWSTSSSATSATYQPGGTYSSESNATLYAVWKANTYSVKYNANGGSGTMSNSAHTYDVSKTLTSNAFTRSGYTFLGWSKDSNATTATYTNAQSVKNLTSVNGDVVNLYAVWSKIPTYTISYNANGGSNAPSSQTKTKDVMLTLSSTKPTRSYTINFFANGGTISTSSKTLNFTFNGWNTNANGSGTSYASGGSYTNNESATLYAQWKAPSAYVLPTPTRTGYTFLGWSTSSTATSATYPPGSTYNLCVDVNLYAVWSKIPTYTISYNANGGNNAPSSQTKTKDVTLTLSSTKPTRTGYTFLGWSTSSTATSATYQPGGNFTTNGDTTLYAVWKANDATLSVNTTNNATISTGGEQKYYTFTPNESGTYVIYSTGSSDTRVYLYNSSGTELADDDDDGTDRNFRLQYNLNAGTTYRFAVGYYSASTTGTIPFKFGKVYTITYNANGGSSAPSSQTKDYGTALTLSSTKPTRSGYTFLGWSTSSTATTSTYSAGGTYSSEANVTLYAVWHKHSYTSRVTTAATCTAAGVRTYTCSVCSDSYTESIAALDHNYSTSYTVDTPATCTTAGSKSQHCSRCSSKQNVTAIPATGHSYTSKVTTAATCTATGVKTYTCSTCSHSYTETIAKLGHNYSTSYTVDTPATCTTAGSKSQHCTRCTAKQNVTVIPATGHNYVNGTCSSCGKINVTTSAAITVSSASASAGNQVKVTISLKNNPGITSMLLSVNYDESKLQLVKVEDCENLGSAFHSNVLSSPFTLSWANDTATSNYTYNGDIVVLTFKVKDDAEVGATPITVTYEYNNYDIIDKDMNRVEFNVENGSINISDVLIGDVNNDGNVNTLDRVILTRYIAKWAEYPAESINMVAADVNCDGSVNTLDRVILTRYIAHWDGYESLPYNN